MSDHEKVTVEVGDLSRALRLLLADKLIYRLVAEVARFEENSLRKRLKYEELSEEAYELVEKIREEYREVTEVLPDMLEDLEI